MATIQQALTPTADRTPAVISIPEKELSGSGWVNKFPGSSSTDDLDATFRKAVNAFLSALRTAGAQISIAATFRPPERAYLMHWCWMVARKKAKPSDVPAMAGVDIQWDHGDDVKSIEAAKEMVTSYGMSALLVAPALQSRHTKKNAIDMNISWSGDLTVNDVGGKSVKISSEPKTGMNTDLKDVGQGYGVLKFVGGATDKPHWSDDGH